MPNLDIGLMAKKHCGDFLRQHNIRDILNEPAHEREWAALGKIKRDAKREMSDLIDQLSDGIDQRKAAEIEAASDAVSTLMQIIDLEMDDRTKIGDRSARADPIAAMRPEFENRVSPAVDGNAIGPIEVEPYSIRSDESLTTWARPRSDNSYEGLSEGAMYRAVLLGPRNEMERRALAEGTDAAGGITVPVITSTRMIDRLRAESVVIRAGAQTVPLTSDQQKIARLATDPAPAFRAENAAITESDPTFDSVTFVPRSLALMIKISRELYEDSLNLERELPRVMAVALAKEVDKIALLGTGTAPEPRGVLNTTGVGATALGGALSSYAPLLVAQTGIATANAGPTTAIIGHPREFGDLATLADSTGQPLRKPDALSEIPMLSTTAIPIDGGGGSNESTLFMGNWSNLMLGIRSGVRVEVLRERFADNHQLGLIAHMRFDVQLQHPAAFWKITGITS